MRRSRAFTLVELLVVIAVIAVLIALLMPALSKARRSAINAVCQNQLRELGMAFFSYCHDNRGTAPGGGWYGVTTGFPLNDPRLIPHYIKPNHTSVTPWIMKCPDMEPIIIDTPPYWGGSYTYNAYWFARFNYFNPGSTRWMRLAVVRNTSRKVVFADGVGFTIGNWASGSLYGDYMTNGRHYGKANGIWTQVLGRKTNTVFADGHVEQIHWTAWDAANRWQEFFLLP